MIRVIRAEVPLVPDTRRFDQASSHRVICDELAMAVRGMENGCHRTHRASGLQWASFHLSRHRLLNQVGRSNFTKSVAKKVVADFIKNNLICYFGVLESIITDNGANLNSHLMKDICKQFKVTHRNSTAYRPQMNGVMEATNKNIKRILRKKIENYRNWHKQLPYALLGYRMRTRTSTRATPYLLVYGTETIIPTEVEILLLRIIQEEELSDAEWVRNHYEELASIDEKRMVVVCHRQLYRQRMSRAFNKRVRGRLFQIEQLILKRVFPHQEEYRGKCAPNWQGPYMVRKVLSEEAIVLTEMDGQEWPKAINADALKDIMLRTSFACNYHIISMYSYPLPVIISCNRAGKMNQQCNELRNDLTSQKRDM
ncbi:uncharacterized protein LOC132637432 [Lycium barbarum]|uniref:uncharacterized protein LOC132637432 n=1 Tax=Lycium barbarum TaxID=112863 RepID=UPI00293F199B|nr:uncharacterized protein LOC132637432 [Lycium barbarum]